MKKIAITVLVVGVFASTAAAQLTRASRRALRPQTPQTLEILNQIVPDLRFEDQPLEQVMEMLRDFANLNLVVRWQTLDDAGVEREKPISLHVKNLRLSQVLWLIMNEAGGSDTKLAYRASGNLLIFSTEEDLSKEMVTKIYDVADLLLRIPNASRRSNFDVSQGMQQAGQSGGGGGGGMFQNNENENYDDNNQYGQGGGSSPEMQTLIDLIQQTIEPDSWAAAGAGNYGAGGTIHPFRSVLVIRATLLVHQKLGGYVFEDK